jgi:tetratricopeptide (TPR) repeat protein
LAEETERARDQTDQNAEVYVLKPDDSDHSEEGEKPESAEPPKPSRNERIERALAKIEAAVKKPVVWGGATLLVMLGVFGTLALVFTASKETVYQPKPFRASEAIAASRDDRELIAINRDSSTLEGMLAKAAMLYDEGSTAQALDIYEQISIFSESVSLYNLGVARMRKGDYQGALEVFKPHIDIDARKTAGAINAAVCALKLGDEPLFRRYIGVAKESLKNESASPLYQYYYTLINYYDNRPFDALIGAAAPSIDYLDENRNLILAKMRLMFSDASGSIDALEKSGKSEHLPTLGLLYARIGDWANAADRLARAISADIDQNRSRSALILVHIKSGFFKDASSLIDETLKLEINPFYYPIRVKLKDRLFDIGEAQNYFATQLLIDEKVFLQAMFNYAPYMMVDPDKSVTHIRKGQIALSGGEIDEAAAFLEQSRVFAGAGARMSAAIKLAINNRLILANQALAQAESEFATSDALEYNLALSYAQLGRFPEAYQRFRRAYYLNPKNIEAGVYAAALSSFTRADESRLIGELTAALSDREDDQSAFWRALLSFHDKNFQGTAQWLERDKKENSPQYILLDIFSADQTNRPEALKKAAGKLAELYPNDILSGIFELYAANKGKPMRLFAFAAQEFMLRRDLNFDSLYYGAPIARDLYAKLGLITGNLESVREILLQRLAVEKSEPRTLMQALITVNIYLQNFEEAYALSNALIDELGVKDVDTLLYGAIASIGAGHKENAIALLQMAKGADPKDRETRYALGLLYQEIGAAKSASLEYSQIGSDRYESRFFDFDIRAADDPERAD